MLNLLELVTMQIWSIPELTASSITYWITGRSTIGSISFGTDFVTGRNRVPYPAAGITAFRTRGGAGMVVSFQKEHQLEGRRYFSTSERMRASSASWSLAKEARAAPDMRSSRPREPSARRPAQRP